MSAIRDARIVLLTNALTGGGAERAANWLGRGLQQYCDSVTIVPLRISQGDPVESTSNLYPLNKVPGSGLAGQMAVLPRFLHALRTLRPTVVHAHCEAPESLLALAPGSFTRVVTEHTHTAWRHRPLLGSAVRSVLRRRDVTWIAPSEETSVWKIGKPDFVIPNALPPREALGFAAKHDAVSPRIVVVSQLIASKRIDWILRAVAGLPTKVSILILGEGRERERLVDMATRLDVRASFPGFVPRPWELIGPGDLYVSASASETDGVSVAEATMLGLEVLVSGIPAHRRQVGERAAFFSSEAELSVLLHRWAGKGWGDHYALLRRREDLAVERSPAAAARAHLVAYGIADRSLIGELK